MAAKTMSDFDKKLVNPFLNNLPSGNDSNSENKNVICSDDEDGEAGDSSRKLNKMIESYSEITNNNNLSDNQVIVDKSDNYRPSRPNSLVCSNVPENMIVSGNVNNKKGNENCYKCKNSFLYNLEGTVSIDDSTNMTHFVAENLEYKIKLASPGTKKETGIGISSRNSTPSNASGTLQKQLCLLNSIESQAQYLAASVDNLTENLCNLLHSISSITADNVETYKNAVNKLTDCMDGNIKSMYTIMAKAEEISNALKPTDIISNKIRELKRLVDMLESNI